MKSWTINKTRINQTNQTSNCRLFDVNEPSTDDGIALYTLNKYERTEMEVALFTKTFFFFNCDVCI